MECEACGGRVEWRGWRFNNFTHSECMACGARNCQRAEPVEEDESEEDRLEHQAVRVEAALK